MPAVIGELAKEFGSLRFFSATKEGNPKISHVAFLGVVFLLSKHLKINRLRIAVIFIPLFSFGFENREE